VIVLPNKAPNWCFNAMCMYMGLPGFMPKHECMVCNMGHIDFVKR
jgi:hypothetical protein